MSNLLSIGSQAAQANQAALNTIGQNISNVNTDGYSRQQVDLVAHPNLGGVYVQDIERITDKFLTQQVWTDLSSYNQSSAYADLSSRLDNLLASDTQSISTALDDYFGALQSVVDDPTSTANRQLFVTQSDALVQRFNDLDANIQSQGDTINQQMDSYAGQITTIASNIADLNAKISVAEATNRSTNEMRDQRDQLTNQLSEIVGVTVVDQSSDQYSIFIGNGQPLVIGSTAEKVVSVLGTDSSQKELAVVNANATVNINGEITGGKVGGLIQYREEALNDARNQLGLIAIGLAESMNEQHRAGINLNNEFGGDLFTDMNDDFLQRKRITPNSNNQSDINVARVEIQNVDQLQASEYELVVGDGGRLTLYRSSDGKQIRVDQLDNVDDDPLAPLSTAEGIDAVGQNQVYIDPNGEFLSFAVDGIKVTIQTDTDLMKGDSFTIQPVTSGAEDLSLVIQSGQELALASPIRISTDIDNQGSGVATVSVTNPKAATFATAGEMSPPVKIVFNDLVGSTTGEMTYTVYDMTDPNSPVPVGALDQTYIAGNDIELDGYSITVANQPKAGDSFSFDFNEDGVSDNRNAFALSNMQQSKLFDQGSYQDLYGSLIEKVGTRTATAVISQQANKAVLDTSISAQSSVSGVNLDEEATKLVQYQQAYQASAQLIRVSQTIFDSLLQSL
ncbi:flagellar hook-associated protein FlgK [Amphritea opalescens]|uniref:Flagellar hook-associated protein 1 n=1 Tax=Amphritea opalescens TaxID=2490544 RepID=A0A430KTP8_9GAMM|nr:flagellar hook-associated protein FlgK [Amphritea opalescens]RTE66867.1 flagellar hook-associated protein FlgK [Amphritea opalescens]